MNQKTVRVLLVFMVISFAGCQKPEKALLEDLTEKLSQVKGNVDQAKGIFKKFLTDNEDQMKNCLAEYEKLDMDAKRERFLEFNRSFYDRTGLFEVFDRGSFLTDPEFDALFEQFKAKMKPFFSEENGS